MPEAAPPAAAPENPLLRYIQVEIPAEVVAQETQKFVERYSKLARVPGFRKGKVPPSIIRGRFAADIKHEVAEALIPRFFSVEVERQGLKPISQPQVYDVHMHDGETWRFRAAFEVMPEIRPSGYEQLKSDQSDTSVTEEEVEQALNHLREQHSTFEPVEGDRGLEDGDWAQVSFTGTAKAASAGEDSPKQEPVSVDDVLVDIGGDNTVKEFSDNLRGAKAGEERTFEVNYPEDFQDKRLAGTTMTYTVQIKGIKRKAVPELNDEFAKQAGEFASMDEMRQHFRDRMQARKKHDAEHAAKEKLVDQLLASNDFPVPETLVDRQVNVRLERGLRALMQQGMREEDLKRLDFERLRAGQREQAVREVKASLLLDSIADTEKIEVTDDELDREVETLAGSMNQTKEAVLTRLTQNGTLERIRERLRNEKTLDYLYNRSA